MKSTWKTLNDVSDQESEEEVDDTKEIQIEEALKLYQNALKLHSESPASSEKAAEAYKALFESEIFKYDESISEYRRHELYGDTLVFDTIFDDDFEPSPVQTTGGNESASNTLHQIIHLAYKNRGQFLLETMQHWIKEHGSDRQEERSKNLVMVLNCFGEALDKDDTDLDLWLRAASVAALLGSRRITRFCLEAVLDEEDDLIDSIMRLPGLEEGFAGNQLKELVFKLEDTLSLALPPLTSFKRKKLSETLKRHLNPYPFAPLPSDIAESARLGDTKATQARIVIDPRKWDWTNVGEALLREFQLEVGGYTNHLSSPAVVINTPIQSHGADPVEAPEAPGAETSKSGEVPLVDSAADGGENGHVLPNGYLSTEPAALDTSDGKDVVMERQADTMEPKPKEAELNTPVDDTATQSRKRSTDSAGLPEVAEGGRSRSKRIRARDTLPDTSTSADSVGLSSGKQLENKLYPYIHADKCLFEVINDILERVGVSGMGSPEQLRVMLNDAAAGNTEQELADVAACSLFSALQSGNPKVAASITSKDPPDYGQMTRESGLSAFLGFSRRDTLRSSSKPLLEDEGLLDFAEYVNANWFSIKEAGFAWIERMLCPGSLHIPGGTEQMRTSKYMHYRWSEELKQHLVQVMVRFDETIHPRMVDRIAKMDTRILNARADGDAYYLSDWDNAQIEMTQTLFELHLDVYSLIKHPLSGVDATTQIRQKDRLDRWSALARDTIQLRSGCKPDLDIDQLALRHIWASVFQLNVDDDVQSEYVVQLMGELKRMLQSTGHPVIELQNNAVMPEISVTAVEGELARISMKDFFFKVFDHDETDPVAVIESLEPILEPCIEYPPDPKDGVNTGAERPDRENSLAVAPSTHSGPESETQNAAHLQEMTEFLKTSNLRFRLTLWHRLREAYEAIDYTPKVLVCYLRIFGEVMESLRECNFRDKPPAMRQADMASTIRILDDVLSRALTIVRDDKGVFECLTYEQLQSSMTALGQALRILTCANNLEDRVRVGHLTGPRFDGLPPGTFEKVTAKLHDIQLRAWMLQYHLLKEGIGQNASAFPTPSEDKFEFLRHVHYATGVRGFAHAAGKLFLRLAKDEILQLDDVIDGNTRDAELAQLLYDLYDIKVFIQPADCQDYGALHESGLDRRTATQLLPFIMAQARKMDIKDISKTELKGAIDKVHGALGRPKTNEDMSINRKIVTNFLKSPINPISLFGCLKGVGALSTKQVPPDAAPPATMGWYFLMGDIALNKFRSQKRLTQSSTEDINFAQAFFCQDLEFSVDRWETWYRLAQANDTQLEEAVAWSVEKLNSGNQELITYQRHAIHCYTMATACAVRDAGVAPQTVAKVADMYSDFGTRMYASTREPFGMHAFLVREAEQRTYSKFEDHGLYQNPPFTPLGLYTAWKFAAVLFKRAIKGKPERWWNHYMLSKCLWKMYCARTNDIPAPTETPTRQEVVAAIVNAINTLPEKRERGREPILEPHYKLLSVVHKLFLRKDVGYKEGDDLLRNTPYSRNIEGPENAEDWKRYITSVLKALRTADKSGWHHRMIARHAHIIYDDTRDDLAADAAKHEMTQHMFTKTMNVQVWKPEYERPGRHFVYTSRYTRFFNGLLDQTGDKVSMELLARRVRRRANDFFEHTKLWQEVCMQYLRLLRRLGQIPESHEEVVFKSINHDEFAVLAARLEAWSQSPGTQDATLDILRDAIELKRTNNSLMRPLLIDDLIGDTYAVLYATVAPRLPPLPTEQQAQNPSANIVAPYQTGAAPLLAVQVDGTSETGPHATSSFGIFHSNQLQTQPPEPPPRGRTKPIGRREIQRRAEAVANKPTASVATPTTMAIRSPHSVHVVIPPVPGPNGENSVPRKVSEQLDDLAKETSTGVNSVANVESSGPASVHTVLDDADDESELSELDESEVRLMQENVDVDGSMLDVIKDEDEGLSPSAEQLQLEGARESPEVDEEHEDEK
ncbi:transcriptional corepressor of histone-like protein genes [Sporormia fimetaria CBS 119925]|uniref:Histone transcription regulator 3 homolog n=1 Tax=Sporormia fimetaria CBS 119925 TaxID=1340428 RepID=A0A6A6VER4_9PLEO|nr:transcriptional corepressor of histone-like protein genes [Sporormia fimetaria CBS 119925]